MRKLCDQFRNASLRGSGFVFCFLRWLRENQLGLWSSTFWVLPASPGEGFQPLFSSVPHLQNGTAFYVGRCFTSSGLVTDAFPAADWLMLPHPPPHLCAHGASPRSPPTGEQNHPVRSGLPSRPGPALLLETATSPVCCRGCPGHLFWCDPVCPLALEWPQSLHRTGRHSRVLTPACRPTLTHVYSRTHSHTHTRALAGSYTHWLEDS